MIDRRSLGDIEFADLASRRVDQGTRSLLLKNEFMDGTVSK